MSKILHMYIVCKNKKIFISSYRRYRGRLGNFLQMPELLVHES